MEFSNNQGLLSVVFIHYSREFEEVGDITLSSSLPTLIVTLTLLVAIHIIYHIIGRVQPDKDYKAIGQRIKTWWGMFFIFCLATLFTPAVSLLSLMVLCFFSPAGMLLYDQDEEGRPPTVSVGLFVNSGAVLLDLHWLVRHVYYFYSRVCVPVPSASAAD